MINYSVKIPKRLHEGLHIKAQELNVKPSELVRDALWEKIQNSTVENSLKLQQKIKKNSLEEQIYFIRSAVEFIVLEMEGGGEKFIDKCHEYTEKLLKINRLE